jgi:Zn-finger protein
MNCQEALSLLYDVVDHEASEIDREQVEEHLKSCEKCHGIFQIEDTWQRFLAERIEERSNNESPALGHLRGRISEELDLQDRGLGWGASLGIVGLTFRSLIMVIAVVLVLVATYVGAGYYGHYRDFHHLELAHHEGVAQSSRFADPEDTRSAIAFVAESVNLNIWPTVGSFQLVGGRITEIDDIQLGHFIYNDASATVSLFVSHGLEMAVPWGAKADDQGYYIHQCDDCRLWYGVQGQARLVAAEVSGEVDMGQFLERQQEVLASTF